MTAPAVAALRFLIACALGLGLGVIYSFLRPLRPRLTGLSDALFVLCLLMAWVYLGFGICGGDLRLGYTAGLFVGICLWEWTAGRLLRPLFFRFWHLLGRIFRAATAPVRAILRFFTKIAKIVFAYGKKSVTIKGDRNKPPPEGVRHEKMAGKAEADSVRLPPQQ